MGFIARLTRRVRRLNTRREEAGVRQDVTVFVTGQLPSGRAS